MIKRIVQNLRDIINTLEGVLAGEECYPNTLLGYTIEALDYLEDDTPITEEFLDKHFKRGYSTLNHAFKEWILPWTARAGFDGFHIQQWAETYIIEDHVLMRFITIGQLKLAFYLMGQDLNNFKEENND